MKYLRMRLIHSIKKYSLYLKSSELHTVKPLFSVPSDI